MLSHLLPPTSPPSASSRLLRCGRHTLDLSRPRVMGIVNVTPDSFSDGGRFLDPAAAIAHGLCLVEQGADVLDVGGESTRPGAQAVSVQEELDRVMPVLEGLRDCGRPLSVDTLKPAVMAQVLASGAADLINDVSGFRDPAALLAVASHGCGLCIMHMQGEPRTMQVDPRYGDVLTEVADFLADRIQACAAAGIARDRILIDPGFGFGKTVAHNLALLAGLPHLLGLGAPVLAGLSRKSTIGQLTGRAAHERLAGSLAAALAAVARGASIVRVHDVAETVDALKIWMAVADAATGASVHQAQES